jgi:hypothetical protein
MSKVPRFDNAGGSVVQRLAAHRRGKAMSKVRRFDNAGGSVVQRLVSGVARLCS